jgi:hypothetical protein
MQAPGVCDASSRSVRCKLQEHPASVRVLLDVLDHLIPLQFQQYADDD